MPIVPSGTNSFRVPHVSAENRPSSTQTQTVLPEAFGVDTRPLEQGLDHLAARLSRMEDENDRARALEAYQAFSDQRRDWDQDVQENVRGGDALGIHRRADETYQAFAKDLSNTLPSDRARGYFDEMVQPARTQALDGWSRYEVAQRDTWMAQITKGTLEEARAQVATHWTDPTRYQTVLRVSEAALRSDLGRKGTTPDAVERAVFDHHTSLVTARIEGAMGEDPLAARQLLDQSGDDLPPSVRQDLDARLQGPLDRQRGALAAQAVMETLDGTDPGDAVARAEIHAQTQGLNAAQTAFCVDGVRKAISRNATRAALAALAAEDTFRTQIDRDPMGLDQATLLAHPDLTDQAKADLMGAAHTALQDHRDARALKDALLAGSAPPIDAQDARAKRLVDLAWRMVCEDQDQLGVPLSQAQQARLAARFGKTPDNDIPSDDTPSQDIPSQA